MKDIPPVAPVPTPGKMNLFQEKPTVYNAAIEIQSKVLLESLMEQYLDSSFSLEDIKDTLEGDFSIERAHLTGLVSEGILDYNETEDVYSLNHASLEVQRRIG